MQFSFIKKAPVSKFTPLNISKDKFPNNGKKSNNEAVISAQVKNEGILLKSSMLFILSLIFFLSGLSFWIYVNYYMK